MIIASFLICLLIFMTIGVVSASQSKSNVADYLIASQSIKPWLAALSAVATTNSGFMFIGMIGFTYEFGLSSFWLIAGWIIGDWLSSLFIHKKLHHQTTSTNQSSYASVISRWQGVDYRYVRLLGGIITLIFLSIYAAAQLKAGSKALYVLLGWPYSTGAIIGSVIILVYCLAGGIRATIWTDVFQSIVMMFAMGLMLFVAYSTLNGIDYIIPALSSVNPHYMNWVPNELVYPGFIGILFFLLGWLFSGIGVIGQPHIMIRFMSLPHDNDIRVARFFYYSWYSLFGLKALAIGLLSRLLIPDSQAFDAELALPTLAYQLMHPLGVGIILAGLFAATMSTADSQILSCTAALSEDFGLNKSHNVWVTKIFTVIVAGLALLVSLAGSDSVFVLVLIAWSCLASSFGPLLISLCVFGKPSQPVAIMMMVSGLLTTLIWQYYGLTLSICNEILPGMLFGFVPYVFERIWLKFLNI